MIHDKMIELKECCEHEKVKKDHKKEMKEIKEADLYLGNISKKYNMTYKKNTPPISENNDGIDKFQQNLDKLIKQVDYMTSIELSVEEEIKNDLDNLIKDEEVLNHKKNKCIIS
jgi:hypothetical protein